MAAKELPQSTEAARMATVGQNVLVDRDAVTKYPLLKGCDIITGERVCGKEKVKPEDSTKYKVQCT
jgi:hypothetical protein